jgi:hypothetical protein
MKTGKDPTLPALKCGASQYTNGRVACDRDVYARGLCKGHYGQLARSPTAVFNSKGRLSTTSELLKPIGGHGPELVRLNTVRVPRMVADTLETKAKEEKISVYALVVRVLEEWTAREKLREQLRGPITKQEEQHGDDR